MTRPQIITLELEDCSEALVKYVERLEQRSNELKLSLDTSEQNAAQQRDMKACARKGRDDQVKKNAELSAQLKKLQSKYDHVLQEAKIHASELDTQKSIVLELCKLFDLRVYDYHCTSKIKEAIATMRSQSVRDGFIEGARQASHNEIGWFGYGVEECADLYVKEVIK